MYLYFLQVAFSQGLKGKRPAYMFKPLLIKYQPEVKIKKEKPSKELGFNLSMMAISAIIYCRIAADFESRRI